MDNLSVKGKIILTLVVTGLILLTYAAIALYKLLAPHAIQIGIGVLIIGGLALIYLAYHHWYIGHMARTLQKETVRQLSSATQRENDLQEHKKWVETQELLHRQQIEQSRLEIEREKVRTEQMKLTLEHERLTYAQRAIMVPTGHTVVFPEDDYKAIASAPRAMIAQRAEQQQEADQEDNELPTNVRYEEVRNQVPRGHILVGIGHRGLETKAKAVGACVWIVGLSGTGKTSTTVLRVEERYADGHKFLGVDPHWFKDDSLTNAVKEYESQFLMPMAKTPEESLNVYQAFLDEFYARKNGLRPKPWQPITLLSDEVGAQMDKAVATTPAEQKIIELLPSVARICGQEARNFLMGGIFISQQATGLAWLRKVALMIMVHQLLMESEKKLACNGNTEVMNDMETWPIGRTYVYGVGFNETGPITVQQPYFSREGRPIVEGSLAEIAGSREIQGDYGDSGQSLYSASTLPDIPKKETITGPLASQQTTVVEQSETASDEVPDFGPDHYYLTDLQIRLFIAYYEDCGNISDSLARIKNENGKGLGGRYFKHASWIVKKSNLKKRGN